MKLVTYNDGKVGRGGRDRVGREANTSHSSEVAEMALGLLIGRLDTAVRDPNAGEEQIDRRGPVAWPGEAAVRCQFEYVRKLEQTVV